MEELDASGEDPTFDRFTEFVLNKPAEPVTPLLLPFHGVLEE